MHDVDQTLENDIVTSSSVEVFKNKLQAKLRLIEPKRTPHYRRKKPVMMQEL